MNDLRRRVQTWRERLPNDERLLVRFMLAAILAFAFFKLASEVAEGDTFALDRRIILSLRSAADPSRSVGPPWLTEAMIDMTAVGGVSVLTLITVLVAGYLLAARRAATALFVIGAIAGGSAISIGLKAFFVRARPDIVPHLVQVDTTSFPSGHAMNSAIVFLTLGTLLARTRTDRSTSLYLVAAAMVLTLLIGASRVYLGVHWPSDVLAGWCIGAAWATLCATVAQALQRRNRLEPEDATDRSA